MAAAGDRQKHCTEQCSAVQCTRLLGTDVQSRAEQSTDFFLSCVSEAVAGCTLVASGGAKRSRVYCYCYCYCALHYSLTVLCTKRTSAAALAERSLLSCSSARRRAMSCSFSLTAPRASESSCVMRTSSRCTIQTVHAAGYSTVQTNHYCAAINLMR